MARERQSSRSINQSGFLARLTRCFARDDAGATAVEFALVATPFLFMLVGIFETMLIFFGGLALEDALDQVGREIKTGQIQSTVGSPVEMTPEEFKIEVCSKLSGLLPNCTDNLLVAVQSFTQFSGAVCSETPDPDNPNPTLPFNTGTAGSTIVACAFYKWQISTPLIGSFLSNISGNRRLLQSTIVFKNEPFTTS